MATTQLSATATPGRRYSFYARSKGVLSFTELSVTATPGQRHSFLAKTATVLLPGAATGGGGSWELHSQDELNAKARSDSVLQRLKEDDRDVFEMIKNIVRFGILD